MRTLYPDFRDVYSNHLKLEKGDMNAMKDRILIFEKYRGFKHMIKEKYGLYPGKIMVSIFTNIFDFEKQLNIANGGRDRLLSPKYFNKQVFPQ